MATEIERAAVPSGGFGALAGAVFGWEPTRLPVDVAHFTRLLMLDLIGVAAASAALEASRIARDHAVRHWAAGPGAPSARLAFDGRRASLPGAAFAIAAQIDNLDAHDGWQPSRGHAGAAALPALLALTEGDRSTPLPGPEAVLRMALGYEAANRAALALHATVDDFHTSGAWNALGVAAMAARARGLGEDGLRHALGIAEYHGPRSQMMREIANPTMLHDGSSMGAAVGVQGALLAEDGFRGAPAATVEFQDAAAFWDDLGTRWTTVEQYVKPYPICRWAHGAIDAALGLKARHGFSGADVASVEIDVFDYAADLFPAVPTRTEIAQYSLAYAVAAALSRGQVGVPEIQEASFDDPELRRLTAVTTARADPALEAAYPERRLGVVTLTLRDGGRLSSGVVEASGGPDPRPDEAVVRSKFHSYADPALGAARAAALEEAVLGLADPASDFRAVTAALADPL